MSEQKKGTRVVGIIVSLLVIAAVASVGYYQFEVAPNQNTTSSTTSQQVCTPATCALVNLTSGAGGCFNPPSVKVCGFAPPTITVVLGKNNTVLWTNLDAAPHTVTGTSFGSGNMNHGNTYQYTFAVAGNYSYFCVYHSWMKANVIVKSA